MSDPYDNWKDASTTPFWDLAVGLLLVVTILGGGLALLFGVGYLTVGRGRLAWPLLTTLWVLVVLNVALRVGRARARRRT